MPTWRIPSFINKSTLSLYFVYRFCVCVLLRQRTILKIRGTSDYMSSRDGHVSQHRKPIINTTECTMCFSQSCFTNVDHDANHDRERLCDNVPDHYSNACTVSLFRNPEKVQALAAFRRGNDKGVIIPGRIRGDRLRHTKSDVCPGPYLRLCRRYIYI